MRLVLAIQGGDRFAGLPARRALVRWVRAALRRDAELTVRFVGAAESRRLNQTYRGKDQPTNVLTFDYARRPVVRADIVLCVPVIRMEAHSGGKTLRQHLAHLTVHAVLHAQGHTHDAPQPARRMEAREIAILSQLGFADPYQA